MVECIVQDLDELRSEMQAGYLNLVHQSEMHPVRRVSSEGGDYQQMLRSVHDQQDEQRLV